MASAAVFIGAMIGNEGKELNYLLISSAIVHAALMLASANIINHFRDMDLDKLKRSKTTKRIGRRGSLIILLFIMPSAFLTLAYSIHISMNIIPFFISMVAFISIITYEYHFKSKGFPGNLLVGFSIGSLFIFGGIYFGVNWTLISISLMASLANVSREIIKDIEDMDADRGFRDTLPIRKGYKFASFLSMVIVMMSFPVAFIPLIASGFNVFYLFLIALSLISMIYASYSTYGDRSEAARSSSIYKSAMIVSLLGFSSYILL